MPVRSGLALLAVLLCATVWQNVANSAELKCVQKIGAISHDARKHILALGATEPPAPGTCMVILIDGEIVAGDADRFREILRVNQPWIHDVYLVSQGGDVAEALSIGRLVRQGLLATFAPLDNGEPKRRVLPFPDGSTPCEGEHCICASACFFIWVAGVERGGNAIGLHRPYIVPEEARKLSLQEAEEAYNRLVDVVQQYLTDMNVPKEYFDRMIRIPSGDIVFLSWRRADKDFGGYVPAIAEWLKSKCGAMTPTEQRDFTDLPEAGHRSAQEEHYYEAYIDKLIEISNCENDEITRERITIAQRSN